IVNLDPDAAPLLPLAVALVSFLTPDLETAARTVSMLASLATMVAVYLLGRRITDRSGAVLGIVLLAVASPYFFRLSYSTLSEPLYIALYAWIVLVFVAGVDRPRLRTGIVLGVLAGLAFLTRVEAV